MAVDKSAIGVKDSDVAAAVMAVAAGSRVIADLAPEMKGLIEKRFLGEDGISGDRGEEIVGSLTDMTNTCLGTFADTVKGMSVDLENEHGKQVEYIRRVMDSQIAAMADNTNKAKSAIEKAGEEARTNIGSRSLG